MLHWRQGHMPRQAHLSQAGLQDRPSDGYSGTSNGYSGTPVRRTVRRALRCARARQESRPQTLGQGERFPSPSVQSLYVVELKSSLRRRLAQYTHARRILPHSVEISIARRPFGSADTQLKLSDCPTLIDLSVITTYVSPPPLLLPLLPLPPLPLLPLASLHLVLQQR